MEQDRSYKDVPENACPHFKYDLSPPQTLFLLLYLFTFLPFPIAFYLFTFLPFYPFQLPLYLFTLLPFPIAFLPLYLFTLLPFPIAFLPLYLFTLLPFPIAFLPFYFFILLPFPPSFYLFTSLHLYLLNKIGPVVKMPRPVRVTLKTAIDSRQYFIMKTFVLL